MNEFNLCNDCIWFREDPNRCIAHGYNKILNNMIIETCPHYTENW